MAYIKGRKHPTARAVSGTTTFGLLAGLALAMPVHAQSRGGAAPAALPQVEITATPVQDRSNDYKVDLPSSPKFTQPLVDTPQTITVVPREVLHEQGATTLTDALRNIPGVGVFSAGENGRTSTGDAVFMRGFDASSSIYVDGVRDVGSIGRDIFNTEQIEVVEGPSGSDFGRSTPTGSINMVTKQPQLEAFTSGSLTLGSANYRRATIDVNRPLAGTDDSAVRLNAMVQDAGVPGRDRVKDKRWGIAPSRSRWAWERRCGSTSTTCTWNRTTSPTGGCPPSACRAIPRRTPPDMPATAASSTRPHASTRTISTAPAPTATRSRPTC